MNIIPLDKAITYLDWTGKILVGFIIIWLFTMVYSQKNYSKTNIDQHTETISLIYSNQIVIINNQNEILKLIKK